MQRQTLIERILRQVYGGQPQDDSNITYGLVNQYLNDGVALAAKQSYGESIKIDGISYVNNSFYTTYKGLAPTTSDIDEFAYRIQLPHIPYGIGKNEGVESLQFRSGANVSYQAYPLSIHELGFVDSLPWVPNSIGYWPEGEFIYVKTVLPLTTYTANVKMISGGDATDLTSTLNVPDDYIPLIIDYVSKQLTLERRVPKDVTNDGQDN
jgi:hypothetical protein